jgi:solute carrier family 35 (UDP-xylose/UDP-N-acetylglucosamine transporter), member B4
MADVVLGLGSVFCGCQANVFLLELIIKGSPDTFYALTCAQYICVGLLTLPLVLRLKAPHEDIEGAASMCPFRLRHSRIPLHNKIILSATAWAMSVANNIVFSFDVSVPLHATFRSSSLMMNMLAGYLFLNKRFTLPQVLCAATICIGLIALTLEKTRKARKEGNTSAAADDVLLMPSAPTWHSAIGVSILVTTTFCTAGLGVFQEYMYRDAHRREAAREAQRHTTTKCLTGSDNGNNDGDGDDAAPLWAEALCMSHLYALPLFLLFPSRLFQEFASIHPANRVHLLLNCLTQLVCIAGVYVMNQRTSAFTLTLTLTLRKLASVTLSVFYFGHYRTFTLVEWVAMVGALAAGTAFSFLPKPPPAKTETAPTPVAPRRPSRSSSSARQSAPQAKKRK